MEGTSEKDAEKIAFDQTVFLSGEQAGKAQSRKGKKVVTACLERRQDVGTATLHELKNTVGKGHGQSGGKSVPVADKANEHIKIYINDEEQKIVKVSQGKGNGHRDYRFYLDAKIAKEDIKKLSVVCK